jgi:signal transduction histidine kinase/FixJ family two-component response regulator/HPt (histidine-containing phosphotransfer) domain-containing protein
MDHEAWPQDAVFRAIADAAPRALWVLAQDGRPLFASRLAREAVGLTSAAAPAFWELLDDAGRRWVEQRLELMRAGADASMELDHEIHLGHLDGTPSWALVRATQIDAGDRYLVLHIGLDSGSSPLADAERIARIGRWRMDLRTERLIGSPMLEELFDRPPGTFPMGMWQFLDHVHPDDRDHARAALRRLVDGEDERAEVDFRIVGRTTTRWARVRAVVHRDPDGQVVQISGTEQEVTDQKLTELAAYESAVMSRLLHTFASAANEAATVRDVLTSARAVLAGHDDWDQVALFSQANRGPVAIEPEPGIDLVSAARSRELAHQAAIRGRTLWDAAGLRVVTPIRASGRIWGALVMTPAPPVRDPAFVEQTVEQVAVQFGRVAERQQAAADLAAARDAAMEGSRLKSAFLATMSHEIRTPLNGVIGLTELLLSTDLDERQRMLATSAQDAGRNLLTLVNDVLDYSKIEAGHLSVERVPVDVRQVVDDVARLLRPEAVRKGLLLETTVEGSVPPSVATDPVRLTQILTNLVSNAVKFTAEGMVTVYVDGDADHLEGVVADSGVGIAPERAEALFEPFIQADASTTRVYGGTGLGLAITRDLVEAMGGSISYAPRLGGGSLFRFSVLLGAAPATVRTRPALPAGTRVLLVEDVEVNRVVAHGLLATLGAEVTDAAGGAEALRLAGITAYDVVLMDVQMPGQDGYDVTRALRAGAGPNQATPVIATTAAAHEAVRDPATLAGMDDFVGKPLSADELARVIGRWVGRSHVPSPDTTPLDLTRLALLADPEEAGPGYLDRALDGVLDSAPALATEIHAAVEAGDLATAADASHRLAGSLLNLGVAQAGVAFRQLEAAARSGERVAAAWEVADQALHRGLAELLAYRGTRPETWTR